MRDRRSGKQQSKQSQIRRKLALSNINKPEDYEQIISNLVGQRERLESDLHVLREKVVALQQKQARKVMKNSNNNGAKDQQFVKERKKMAAGNANLRDELTRKYEQLKQWQKRSTKTLKNTAVQAQYRTYLDQLFNLQQQIQSFYRKYNDQKTSYQRLKKALKELDRQQQSNQTIQTGIQHENHQLKRRIASIRRMVDKQMNKQIDLQNCLIGMRDRQRQIVEREREIRREKSRLGRERSLMVRDRNGVRGQSRNQLNRGRSLNNHHQQSRIGVRHRTQTAKTIQKSQQSSSSSSFSQKDSLTIAPGEYLTEDEIYQIEGHLNRVESRYRDQIIKIQKRLSQNYPNQMLGQRRQGSKLSFSKQIQLLLDRIKNQLNVYHELNKHKISKYLQKLRDKNDDRGYEGRYTSTSLAAAVTHERDSYYKKSKSARKLKQIVNDQPKIISQQKIMVPRVYEEEECQTDPTSYNDLEPLRRQFVGSIVDHRTDDRDLLKDQKNSTIRTLNVFYTDRGIASVQAIYTLHSNPKSQGSSLQGKLYLPEPFRKNFCKIHSIDTEHQDFIRYFKLRYNVLQNRITSIKTVTNRNIKGGFSDHKLKGQQYDPQVEKIWVFDINQNEFPVSMFASHVQKGPYWYLCGLGAEVNYL